MQPQPAELLRKADRPFGPPAAAPGSAQPPPRRGWDGGGQGRGAAPGTEPGFSRCACSARPGPPAPRPGSRRSALAPRPDSPRPDPAPPLTSRGPDLAAAQQPGQQQLQQPGGRGQRGRRAAQHRSGSRRRGRPEAGAAGRRARRRAGLSRPGAGCLAPRRTPGSEEEPPP